MIRKLICLLILLVISGPAFAEEPTAAVREFLKAQCLDCHDPKTKEAGLDLQLKPIEKWEFYKAVATPDHVLTIQTADQQRFANLLLTVGVRMD